MKPVQAGGIMSLLGTIFPSTYAKSSFCAISLDAVVVMAIPCSLRNVGVFPIPIVNGSTSDCGTCTVRCFFLIAMVCPDFLWLSDLIFCVMMPLVTCVCYLISSPKSMLSNTRLMVSFAENSRGIILVVSTTNCARAVSKAIVEDKETQCPSPFKIRIRLEHPDSCRTVIASARDLGVWNLPLLLL